MTNDYLLLFLPFVGLNTVHVAELFTPSNERGLLWSILPKEKSNIPVNLGPAFDCILVI